jgi:uncharacterized protein (TIGR00251 family)
MMISIKVKPNSQKEEVARENDNYFTILVKEKAENNKANIAVIRLLSKYFRVPSSQISIKTGMKSRKKIIEIIR